MHDLPQGQTCMPSASIGMPDLRPNMFSDGAFRLEFMITEDKLWQGYSNPFSNAIFFSFTESFKPLTLYIHGSSHQMLANTVGDVCVH